MWQLCGETRLLGNGSIYESVGNYVLFWQGHTPGHKHLHGVGRTLRRRYADLIITGPVTYGASQMNFISAYALTRYLKHNIKCFLCWSIYTYRKYLTEGTIILFERCQCPVGEWYTSSTLSDHGLKGTNSNGELLLQLCASLDLVMTNTCSEQGTGSFGSN